MCEYRGRMAWAATRKITVSEIGMSKKSCTDAASWHVERKALYLKEPQKSTWPIAPRIKTITFGGNHCMPSLYMKWWEKEGLRRPSFAQANQMLAEFHGNLQSIARIKYNSNASFRQNFRHESNVSFERNSFHRFAFTQDKFFFESSIIRTADALVSFTSYINL